MDQNMVSYRSQSDNHSFSIDEKHFTQNLISQHSIEVTKINKPSCKKLTELKNPILTNYKVIFNLL